MKQDDEQKIQEEVEEGLCKVIINIETEAKTTKKMIVFDIKQNKSPENKFIYLSKNRYRQVIFQEKISYQYLVIKTYQYENELIIGADGTKIKDDQKNIKLDYENDPFPIQILKYFEKEREFSLTNFKFEVCGFLKVSDQTNPNQNAIYNIDQTSKQKENLRLENKAIQNQYNEEECLVQSINQNNTNIKSFVLIKITKNTNLKKDYNIQENYGFTDQIQFPFGYFCTKANGQIDLQNIQFEKIIKTNEIKISGIDIKGLSIEISNIFVYVCYQFQIKTLLQATPIGILDYKVKSPEQNEITLRLGPKFEIPSIYEGEKVSCKHFVVFHIQFQQQFYMSKYPNIEVMFPIVILKNSESEHEYVKNSYFTPEYSEALVDFKQINEQGPFTPSFGQLLEYHFN